MRVAQATFASSTKPSTNCGTVTVAMALIVAGMIDAVEAGEFVDRQDPEQPRREVEKALDDLQQSLHDLADVG